MVLLSVFINVQDEGLLYLDSEEEADLSGELAMEELTLASTNLSPLFSALVNDHYLVSSLQWFIYIENRSKV